MTFDTNKLEDKIITTIEQEYKILAEYKMVESERINGIYVIPSYGNSLMWYGVLFVRQGIYADAVFRFTVLLPDKFPEEKIGPNIIFQHEIFHPFICPFTGTLDISGAFPQWRTGEDHIWQVLKYIQVIFNDPLECLRLNTSMGQFSNKDAADLLKQNRAAFITRAKANVELSKEHIYDEPPTEDPHYITFEKFDKNIHGLVMDKIKADEDSLGTVPNGLSWVKEGEFKPLSVE